MTYPILRFFSSDHLPEHLRVVAEPFAALAEQVATIHGGSPEVATSLRKLLEAKDCAVRAAVEHGA